MLWDTKWRSISFNFFLNERSFNWLSIFVRVIFTWPKRGERACVEKNFFSSFSIFSNKIPCSGSIILRRALKCSSIDSSCFVSYYKILTFIILPHFLSVWFKKYTYFTKNYNFWAFFRILSMISMRRVWNIWKKIGALNSSWKARFVDICFVISRFVKVPVNLVWNIKIESFRSYFMIRDPHSAYMMLHLLRTKDAII